MRKLHYFYKRGPIYLTAAFKRAGFHRRGPIVNERGALALQPSRPTFLIIFPARHRAVKNRRRGSAVRRASCQRPDVFPRSAPPSPAAMAWLVDPEDLIPLVESRPFLYTKSMQEYTNKTLKHDAWAKVTRTLSSDWDSLSKAERDNRCRIVQMKWKHLRDNFRREHQSSSKLPDGSKKRKMYRYYDRMKFLIPEVEEPRTSRKSVPDDYLHVEIKEASREPSDEEEDALASPPSASWEAPRKAVFEEVVLKPMDCPSGESTDEDRSFCLSLVQSFKRMDYDSKMLAKIEILRILHHFCNAKAKDQTLDPPKPIIN